MRRFTATVTVCVAWHRGAEPNRDWRPIPGPTWNAADQAACGDLDDTDYVGVYVSGHYDFATGLFGASRKLEDVSIMRLEPLPLSSSCSP